MREKTLSPHRPSEEPREKKLFGVPLTENMRTGIKYLGPIVAIAALELGFGFYSECNRTKKIETSRPASSEQIAPVQMTDMPIPTYRWAAPLKRAVEDLSKGSEYTGQ